MAEAENGLWTLFVRARDAVNAPSEGDLAKAIGRLEEALYAAAEGNQVFAVEWWDKSADVFVREFYHGFCKEQVIEAWGLRHPAASDNGIVPSVTPDSFIEAFESDTDVFHIFPSGKVEGGWMARFGGRL